MREGKSKFGGRSSFGSKSSFGGRSRDGEGGGRDREDRGSGRSFSSSRSFGGGGRSSFGGSRSFGGGGERRRPEMHQGVCDSCGKECEVPFKPTGSKPLFCSECFRKKEGGSDSRSESSPSKSFTYELDIINQKLDKIMKKLEIE